MKLVIEVRQVMLAGPFANLLRRSVGVPVVVVTVAIALMQPALVLALQLVVENHPLDARAALQQPRLACS